MIISHKHKFVFVKTHKTAGTRIEAFLAEIAGDDAVVTPVDPPVEGHVARNYTVPDDVGGQLVWRARTRPSAKSRTPRTGTTSPRVGIRTQLGRRRWDGVFHVLLRAQPVGEGVSGYYFATGVDGAFAATSEPT